MANASEVDDRNGKLTDLKHFKENFVLALDGNCVHHPKPTRVASEDFSKRKDDLLAFHKSFHLSIDKDNNNSSMEELQQQQQQQKAQEGAPAAATSSTSTAIDDGATGTSTTPSHTHTGPGTPTHVSPISSGTGGGGMGGRGGGGGGGGGGRKTIAVPKTLALKEARAERRLGGGGGRGGGGGGERGGRGGRGGEGGGRGGRGRGRGGEGGGRGGKGGEGRGRGGGGRGGEGGGREEGRLLEDSSVQRKRRKRRSMAVPKNFAELYEIIEEEKLGEGAHSSVFSCRERATGLVYAVKVVPKGAGGRQRALREIEILHICKKNRNVVHLLKSFEEDKQFYLVCEKINGGPLLAHIKRRQRFTEREACQVVGEVALVLSFLHRHGVAHRDLKPDNILCERSEEVTPVRICDFDLSSMVTTPPQEFPLSSHFSPYSSSSHPHSVTTPQLCTPVGSAEYMAPEVLDTFTGEAFSYDKKCDLWSLGVLLFIMLSGKAPFFGCCGDNCGWERGENCVKCQDMLLSKIRNGEYEFLPKDWHGVSHQAKDLIARLLVRDARERLSADQVLAHPWLKDDAPQTPLATPSVLGRSPSMIEELSQHTASCLAYKRQLSSTYSSQPLVLSPTSSSELAARRSQSPAPKH